MLTFNLKKESSRYLKNYDDSKNNLATIKLSLLADPDYRSFIDTPIKDLVPKFEDKLNTTRYGTLQKVNHAIEIIGIFTEVLSLVNKPINREFFEDNLMDKSYIASIANVESKYWLKRLSEIDYSLIDLIIDKLDYLDKPVIFKIKQRVLSTIKIAFIDNVNVDSANRKN